MRGMWKHVLYFNNPLRVIVPDEQIMCLMQHLYPDLANKLNQTDTQT